MGKDIGKELEEMAIRDLKSYGLPEEALPALLKLYVYAATGEREKWKPPSLRELEERLPEKPVEELPKAVRLEMTRKALPGALVQVPYRLLGGRERTFTPEEETRILRLLKKGLNGFQVAVLFLLEEYAQSGRDFEGLKAEALERVGRRPEWLFHLLEAERVLAKKGLLPQVRRNLA